ncbi:MAG: hypothetical protein GY711_00075 [bacterium]|nr:hypothetical protein [bacterium]
MKRLLAAPVGLALALFASGQEAAEPREASELAEMQPRINRAIDGGIDHLVSTQLLDGSWPEHQNLYPSGATALAAYALVKSGVPPRHQAVRRALAYLDQHPPERTYEAGCHLLLYAALDPAIYRSRAEIALDALLEWQVGDWGYPGTHGDPSASHRDLSNTQYGALGLWAATKLDLQVPRAAWAELARATLDYLQQVEDAAATPPGFGYRPNGTAASGSMTTAGVSVLSLAMPHLDKGLRTEAERAYRRGLLWLDGNFKPNANPGGGWKEYYLYGVERVGAFTGETHFNGMNWYLAGARHLLGEQKGAGYWGGEGDWNVITSFVLLFLTKASGPVTGSKGRSARTYGTDDPVVGINLRASGDDPLAIWISSFGEKLREDWCPDGEVDKGPRVVSVEYLTSGGVLLPDSRDGGAEWLHTARTAADGWHKPGFEPDGRRWKRGLGGFGRPDSPQLVVRTPWIEPELRLLHTLRLDPSDLIAPRLELSFSAVAIAGADRPKVELVKLYDEETAFADLLTGGEGSSAAAAEGRAKSGDQHLVVNGNRSNPRMPGWVFPIREKPVPGEFRYMRFAWRKDSGPIRLHLAVDGEWTRAVRYRSGPDPKPGEKSVLIEKDPPKRWTVVTVDLWEALQHDGLLTGIGLDPADAKGKGEGRFDAIYLASTKKALRRIPGLRDVAPSWRGAAVEASAQDASSGPSSGVALSDAGTLRLWINGVEVLDLAEPVPDYEIVLADDELIELLRRGDNTFAVLLQNGVLGSAFDLSLRDDKRLARFQGDHAKPTGSKRYAARVKFPRPGPYSVRARVELYDPESGETGIVESPDLDVQIHSAFAGEMLEYVTDSSRNLLSKTRPRVSASSQRNNWPATQAVDDRQGLGWMCADGDPNPALKIQLPKPTRADTLTISPIGGPLPGKTGQAKRVQIFLNGKMDAPIVADVPRSRTRKTVVSLGKPVRLRSLEIRIVDREGPQGVEFPAVGFAEVELQLRRAK